MPATSNARARNEGVRPAPALAGLGATGRVSCRASPSRPSGNTRAPIPMAGQRAIQPGLITTNRAARWPPRGYRSAARTTRPVKLHRDCPRPYHATKTARRTTAHPPPPQLSRRMAQRHVSPAFSSAVSSSPVIRRATLPKTVSGSPQCSRRTATRAVGSSINIESRRRVAEHACHTQRVAPERFERSSPVSGKL